jgi:hypothetical protein
MYYAQNEHLRVTRRTRARFVMMATTAIVLMTLGPLIPPSKASGTATATQNAPDNVDRPKLHCFANKVVDFFLILVIVLILY